MYRIAITLLVFVLASPALADSPIITVKNMALTTTLPSGVTIKGGNVEFPNGGSGGVAWSYNERRKCYLVVNDGSQTMRIQMDRPDGTAKRNLNAKETNLLLQLGNAKQLRKVTGTLFKKDRDAFFGVKPSRANGNRGGWYKVYLLPHTGMNASMSVRQRRDGSLQLGRPMKVSRSR